MKNNLVELLDRFKITDLTSDAIVKYEAIKFTHNFLITRAKLEDISKLTVRNNFILPLSFFIKYDTKKMLSKELNDEIKVLIETLRKMLVSIKNKLPTENKDIFVNTYLIKFFDSFNTNNDLHLDLHHINVLLGDNDCSKQLVDTVRSFIFDKLIPRLLDILELCYFSVKPALYSGY